MPTQEQPRWDPVRFLTTLNYFGEVPFLGSFRWLQQLLGQNPRVPGKKMDAMKRRVVLLAPHLSPLAEQLQQQALPSVEWIVCPIEADQILAANGGQGGAIAPFEKQLRSADTVAILEDLRGLVLLSEVSAYLEARSSRVWQSVFDFSHPDCDLSMWGALDDVVMGGVSQGSFFLQNRQMNSQQAVFTGNISTDNSGGFSSVRTQNFDPPFDFSNWEGIGLRVKGDGNRYKFIARNSEGWDSAAYIYSFDTIADTWIEVSIPFSELVPTFRARSVPNAPAFDPQRVHSLQLMLSKFEYDRELNPSFTPGAFALAMSEIAVQRGRCGVPLLVVESRDEREQQQSILQKSGVAYQIIGSDAKSPTSQAVDSVSGIVQAILQSVS